MTEDNSYPISDGGTAEVSVTEEERVDYLDQEINILRPSTPFMRDKVRMIWILFVIWAAFVFGPVTISMFAEEFMIQTQLLGGYPLLYLLTATATPAAALVLSAVYAWYRDTLDEKYDIRREVESETEAVAADGGEG